MNYKLDRFLFCRIAFLLTSFSSTSEKITSFEAHPDYIRAIAVHPTSPFVLTASDDMLIKLVSHRSGDEHYSDI